MDTTDIRLTTKDVKDLVDLQGELIPLGAIEAEESRLLLLLGNNKIGVASDILTPVEEFHIGVGKKLSFT